MNNSEPLTPRSSTRNEIDDFSFEAFQALEIFKNTSLHVIKTHLKNCVICYYPENTLILDPQKNNNSIYGILEGELAIYHQDDSSEAIASVGVGETVGEISIFDGQKPSAYVKTKLASHLLVISSEALWAMVDDSHEISRNLLHILARRIRSGNATVLNSLQLQRKHAREAHIDALTGLHNRRWINNTLNQHYLESQQQNTVLSLVIIDIDHFKKFNDAYGHLAGDQVLKQVASAMKGKLRPNEIVARFGGEEFVILLPGVPTTIAAMIAERVRKGVENCFYHDAPSNQRIPVTVSLGIAQLASDESVEDLIRHADIALYQAKENGRNRIQIFSA